MLKVIRALYIFHQHIIDVYFHGAPNQVLEDFVNHSLERGPSILESEGHHLVAVDSPTNSESCLVFIWWVHLDLIIPGIGVHEAKKFVARRRFYQLIDPRKGITVLRANFIEVDKVDADSPLVIFFLHENGIGEPFRVERSRMKPA